MTDADEPAVRRVTTDGITVEKSLAEDRFPVPAVQFQITSDRDEEVEIRVTDVIPDEVPMDHIGFHPDFESDHWTAFSDHRVRYERELDPGEDVETVYGIREDASFDSDAFLSDPSVSTADPSQAVMGVEGADVGDLLADGVPDDADRLVREMFGDEDGVMNGGVEPESRNEAGVEGSDPMGIDDLGDMADPADDETTAEMDLGRQGTDGKDPAGSAFDEEAIADSPSDDALFRDADPVEEDPFEDSGDGTEDGPESTPETSESAEPSPPDRSESADLAVALLAELRSGTVDAEVRDALRDELVGGEVPPSMEVRIKHVQSRVEDLAAYTDALESFIDDQGTASVIEELDADIEAVRDSVAQLEQQLEADRQDRADVANRVQELENALADIASVEEDLTAIRTQVENFEDRLDTTETDVEETAEDLGAIRSEVRALSDDIAELSDRMEQFEAVAADVEDLEDDVGTIENDIDSLESWRDTVSDAFGG